MRKFFKLFWAISFLLASTASAEKNQPDIEAVHQLSYCIVAGVCLVPTTNLIVNGVIHSNVQIRMNRTTIIYNFTSGYLNVSIMHEDKLVVDMDDTNLDGTIDREVIVPGNRVNPQRMYLRSIEIAEQAIISPAVRNMFAQNNQKRP